MDAVIDAITSTDADAIIDMVHFTVAGCTHAVGLGGPPKCEKGQKEGTPVEVFPIMGPGEGSFAHRTQIDTAFPAGSKSLFAVFRVADSAYAEDYWSAGRYGIALRLDGESLPAITLRVDDAAIVWTTSTHLTYNGRRKPVPGSIPHDLRKETTSDEPAQGFVSAGFWPAASLYHWQSGRSEYRKTGADPP